jgi:hypothetical protein
MTPLRPTACRGHFDLLLEERLPAPDLLAEERLPALALARSLWALLFCELALPPLLAACARLIFPEGDEDLEGEEELRDAIACSFGWLVNGRCSCCGRPVNLGRRNARPVGMPSACA